MHMIVTEYCCLFAFPAIHEAEYALFSFFCCFSGRGVASANTPAFSFYLLPVSLHSIIH